MIFMRSIAIWLAGLPIPGCERGTGEEVQDLRRDVRLEWWNSKRLDIKRSNFRRESN